MGGAGSEAMGTLTSALDYPMFVVTAAAGDEQAGCLVGFATQCSIDPLRFLVCLSRKNRTCRVAAQARALAVHLLTADQRELAELFGTETGDAVDKFARCRWVPGPEGTAVLSDCPDWFVGRTIDRFELGDHLGFLVEVVQASASAAGPGGLLMFQHVRDLEPGHGA